MVKKTKHKSETVFGFKKTEPGGQCGESRDVLCANRKRFVF